MSDITLPPDLEQYAAEAVAAGRFADIGEVARAGLTLLRQSDAELADFVASLDAAKVEGERIGFRSLDEVMRDADILLEEIVGHRS